MVDAVGVGQLPTSCGAELMTPVILFLSRHQLLPAQTDALRIAFPGHRLVQYSQPYRGCDEIETIYDRLHADELLMDPCPLGLAEELCERGFSPIRAVMVSFRSVEMNSACPGYNPRDYDFDPHKDVNTGNGRFRFSHFERVRYISVEVENLPIPERSTL